MWWMQWISRLYNSEWLVHSKSYRLNREYPVSCGKVKWRLTFQTDHKFMNVCSYSMEFICRWGRVDELTDMKMQFEMHSYTYTCNDCSRRLVKLRRVAHSSKLTTELPYTLLELQIMNIPSIHNVGVAHFKFAIYFYYWQVSDNCKFYFSFHFIKLRTL
jgi:hypothetical protein